METIAAQPYLSTSGQGLREEAMRMAIECVKRDKDVTPFKLAIIAEMIHGYLKQGKVPVRPKRTFWQKLKFLFSN